MIGKKALITGGALRIGNAVTMKLVEAGADVAVHFNKSETDAYELCDLINNDGGTAFPIEKDLSGKNAAAELFEELDAYNFRPDILINSASIYQPQGILEGESDSYHTNIDVNSLVPLFLSREMACRVNRGVIINFLDSRITDYDHLHVPYHLSKKMLFSITRMLSHELAPGIRVNAIAPGAILAPPGSTPWEIDKWKKRVKEDNPLKSIGTTEQISETLVFLVQNDFITGQVIFVDGGRHMKGSFYCL
ncbi:MAG: SDR family oxidoreductase [Spirochaetaceae bacterium]|nr:SDR family oxidoreductase [Spirochaetaceae bacterium]